MMKHSLRLASLFLALSILSGCAVIPYKNLSNKTVTPNPAPAGYATVQHIHEQSYQFFLFWGLLPLNAKGQEGAFANYLPNGDAIVNARSVEQYDVISWLASTFTYGIVHLKHTEFEGDLVKKA